MPAIFHPWERAMPAIFHPWERAMPATPGCERLVRPQASMTSFPKCSPRGSAS
jgi:hypothetical protein